jgi:hypothetical protein
MRVAGFLLIALGCCAQTSGPWLFSVHKSPMDDSRAYILHTASVKALSRASADLILRCTDGTLNALVSTNEPVDWDGGRVAIRTRMDAFDPAEEDWERVEGDRGFILTGYDAEQFVKDLAESKRLRIEYKTLLGQHRYIVAFNVSGLKSRLSQLRGCLLSPDQRPLKPRACLSNLDSGCVDKDGTFHPMGRAR